MLKHNKKRNIKIIYEQLISLMTNLAASGNQPEANHVLSLVKKHYNKNSFLGRELKLFEAVLSPKGTKDAEKILNEALAEAGHIDSEGLTKAQNLLIQDINEQLSASLYRIPIKDYKLMASTQILLNEARNGGKYTTPSERVKIKNLLVERIGAPVVPVANEEMDNLTFKLVINKFNQKYSKLLNEDQKEILNNYSLFLIEGTDGPIKATLTEKASKIKGTLKAHLSDKFEDAELPKLIKEAYADLEKFNPEVDEETVYKLMRYFDIVEDLERND